MKWGLDDIFLSACLINSELYEQRLLALQDLDGDGFSPQQGDCDDSNMQANPLAIELCDGIDNDCNGQIDEVENVDWFFDQDGDGFGGDLQMSTFGCTPPDASWVFVSGDCDDENALIFPGAAENWRNGFVDNDCDGNLEAIIQDMTPVDEEIGEIKEMIIVGDSVLAHASGDVYLYSSGFEKIVSSDETVLLQDKMVALQNDNFVVEQHIAATSKSFFRRYELIDNTAEKMSGFLALDNHIVQYMESVGDYFGTGSSLFVFTTEQEEQQDIFFIDSDWEADLFIDDVSSFAEEQIDFTGEIWSVGDIDEDGYDDIGLGRIGEQRLAIFLGGEQPNISNPFWTLQTTNECTIYAGGDLNMDGLNDIGCAKNFGWIFADVKLGGTDDLDSATVMYRSEMNISAFNSYSNVTGEGRAVIELAEPTADGVSVFLAWETEGVHSVDLQKLGFASNRSGASIVTTQDESNVLLWWNPNSVEVGTLPSW